MRRLWWLPLVPLAVSCGLLLRVDSYRPYVGICSECADPTGLSRPPCPPLGRDAGPDTTADGGWFVYAWRALSLGAEPPDGGSFDVGLDQDCSSRPDHGRPVLCQPSPPADGLFLKSPPIWRGLPGGIDNSLGQRVLAPLLGFAAQAGTPLDVEAILSLRLERGEAGELVVVQGWNGLPDDENVTVVFMGTPGVRSPPALWDGTDRWIPGGALDGYPAFTGYVSGGVLVVDTRFATVEDVRITLRDNHGNPQTFFIAGRLMARVGAITPEALTLVSYGRWDLADARAQVDAVAGFLSGEASADAGSTVRNILVDELPGLLTAAADLPLGEGAPPELPCTAISLALKATAPRVTVEWP